jgi:serine phosphatase RsbU (regulator of sigma subunit)
VRTSLSVKLVLATSVVVAVAVGTGAWFSQAAIEDLTETQLAARRAQGEHEIERGSELIVGNAATALSFPLPNHVEPDINAVLAAAIREDQVSKDDRLRWMAVVEAGQRTYATEGAPAQDTIDGLLRRIADGELHGSVRRAKLPSGSDWVYAAPVWVGAAKPEWSCRAPADSCVLIGVSTERLDKQIAAALADATDDAHRARNRVLVVSLVVLVIGILLAALQGVQLSRPIKALTVQAERIGAGDLGIRVPEDRRDELGVLAHTFNVMADHIVLLLNEQAHKASLEKEMELARQVQQAMLPPDTLAQHGSFKVVGYCQPASSCGGDWWTYRKLSNGRMLLVVGDATGHGIHSAMIAATARGAVEALSGIDERLLTPEQILRAIDSAIRQVGEHNVLMTAFASLFDSTTGVLHYANAGHNFPYVIKLGATRVLEQASIIAASGNPLGDRQIAVEIRRGSLQLRPGDLFVCFTDGVVERSSPTGKLFGDRKLRGVLQGQVLDDDGSLVRLREVIVRALEHHGEGTLAEDDITFVLCHYDPAMSSGAGRASRRSVA